jgi:small subunit ribosomal protein S19
MARSLKKGPFVDQTLLNKVEDINRRKEQKRIMTWSRSCTVVPIIIGYTIGVHNGREHFLVLIKDQMVGRKLGEFSPTRTFRGYSAKNTKRLYFLLLFLWDKKPIQLEFDWELIDVRARYGMKIV